MFQGDLDCKHNGRKRHIANDDEEEHEERGAMQEQEEEEEQQEEKKVPFRGFGNNNNNNNNKYQTYLDEYNRLIEEQKNKWRNADEETLNQLLEDEIKSLNVTDQYMRRKYPSFYWPFETPVLCKVEFLKNIAKFTTSSDPDILVQYFITLQDLNEQQHVATVVESLFACNTVQITATIEHNLAFLASIDPTEDTFAETPFSEIPFNAYRLIVFRLLVLHSENVTWSLHMKASKEARARGVRAPPLCEAPPIDDLARPNADHDAIKYTNHELLLQFLFRTAGEKGLRRTEKNVYEPIFTDKGYNTRCFKILDTIDGWVRSVLIEQSRPKEYHMFMEGPNTHRLISLHLSKQPNPLFPFLKRCRTLWSFVNGIYNGHTHKFYQYDSPRITDPNIRTVKLLPADVATAKYFNKVIEPKWFEEGFDFENGIDCTNTEKLLRHHGYHGDDLAWVSALCGRLQHDIGSKDDWANALHLKGPPKTGKSAFLAGIREWYTPDDIGMISDDVEKFADQHLLRCFIVMCMDISREFGLPATRFLSWCSGDWLNVFQKFAESVSHKWCAPPVFGSNDDPPITVQGAFRRFVILCLMNTVENANNDLAKKVLEEAPLYLIKCSFHYHKKLEKYGKLNLWDKVDGQNILPEIFWKAKKEFVKRYSWADAYVLSGELEFGTYDPTDEVKKHYVMHESEFEAGFKVFRDSHRDAVEAVISSKTRKEVAFKCTRHSFNNSLKEFGDAHWDDDGYVYNVKPATGLRNNNNNNVHFGGNGANSGGPRYKQRQQQRNTIEIPVDQMMQSMTIHEQQQPPPSQYYTEEKKTYPPPSILPTYVTTTPNFQVGRNRMQQEPQQQQQQQQQQQHQPTQPQTPPQHQQIQPQQQIHQLQEKQHQHEQVQHIQKDLATMSQQVHPPPTISRQEQQMDLKESENSQINLSQQLPYDDGAVTASVSLPPRPGVGLGFAVASTRMPMSSSASSCSVELSLTPTQPQPFSQPSQPSQHKPQTQKQRPPNSNNATGPYRRIEQPT